MVLNIFSLSQSLKASALMVPVLPEQFGAVSEADAFFPQFSPDLKCPLENLREELIPTFS